MKFTDLDYQKKDGIASLFFNRPKKLNAFRKQTRKELIQALSDFSADKNCRVLIISGHGRAFCAGADLEELDFDEEEQFNEDKHRSELAEFQEITRQLMALDKPVIAALNGLAIGVGLEIALACDIRIASTEFQFSFAEVKRGLFQTNGVLFILPRLIGFGKAMDLMMTGRKVQATEAQQLGIVSQLTEPETLMPEVLATAQVLKNNAPISLRLLKKLGWKAMETGLEEVMEMEVEATLECLNSKDLREGIQAFLEKRQPVYRGE